MPSITYDNVKEYSSINTPIFVETGTYMGDTTSMMAPHFEKIYTIDVQPQYVKNARDKFRHYLHISVLEGDSSIVLKELCGRLNKPVFFWLDGHYSGGDTGKGIKDCPLLEEVDAINELCVQACVVAIDDVRLFDTNKTEDWLGVTREKILDIFKSRIQSVKYFPSEHYHEDRMIVTLGPK